MTNRSKYPKTEGYWVYAHITPEKDVYIGMSKQQPNQRWKPSAYKWKSLESYIKQYGWDNIEHRVLIDNLTKAQAEQIEDWFITQITQEGFCINKYRSGGIYRDNRKDYDKDYLKQIRSTPEGKIYDRVNAYNQYHPDLAIETPLEAKQKYLDWGYIPSYVKNVDLY